MRFPIRLLLIGALLGLAQSPCHSDSCAERSGGAFNGPFREVPAQDAAYAQVRALQPYLWTGYPDSAFSGQRGLTRYEFAAALQRMCQEPERLLAAARRTREPRLRPGPPTRPDSPWKHVRISPADNPLRELATLVQEFSPEMKMLGANVDRTQEDIDVCLRRGLVPRPRQGAESVWDAVWHMQALPSPVARAEAVLKLLRQEAAQPSPDTRYLAGPEEDSNLLDVIVAAAAGSHAEAGAVLDAWRAAEPGRLRDCLTVLLGRLGVAHAREELRVCAADAEMPQPLRVMAVEALRNAAGPADIPLLVRLAQSDGAAYRGLEFFNCMEQGPEGWHYPVRRAARDVLARLTPLDATTRAVVKRTVAHAVVFEKPGTVNR